MGLRLKFNLVLLIAFVVGLALAATLSYRIVRENAQREVSHEAAIMITAASAIRNLRISCLKGWMEIVSLSSIPSVRPTCTQVMR